MTRTLFVSASLAAMLLTGAAPQDAPPPADDDTRIVGGSPAGPDNPWQVEIFSTALYSAADLANDRAKGAGGLFLSDQTPQQRAHRCGGVYIGDNWILTAAHCLTEVAGDPLETRRIRMGTRDLTRPGTIYRIERAVIHAGFTGEANPPPNDIALIRVDGKPVATPIRLLGDAATDRPVSPGDNLRVTGWGFRKARAEGARSLAVDNTPNPPSPLLYQVNLTPRSAGCEAPSAFAAKMICAGAIKAGEDSCNGDSGGPMTRALGPRTRILVGLVSWGRGCAQAGKPGVYTAVAGYRDWIARAKTASKPRKLIRFQ